MTTASRLSKKAKRAKVRKQAKTKGRAGKVAKATTDKAKVGSRSALRKTSAKGNANAVRKSAGQKPTASTTKSVGASKTRESKAGNRGAAAAVGASRAAKNKGVKVTTPREESSGSAASARTALRGQQRRREANASRRAAEQEVVKPTAAVSEPRATKTSRRGAGKRTTLAKGRPTTEAVAEKSEQGARSGVRDAGRQLEFGFGSERSELAVLQKQHRHLLLQIAKRRALITVSKQAVEELMKELSERVIPYREELFAITREVCDLRDRLLDSSGLPASQLEKVRWALSQMLTSLPLEEAEEGERGRGVEDSPADRGASASSNAARDSNSRPAAGREARASEGEARASSTESVVDGGARDVAAADSNDAGRVAAAAREAAQPEAASAVKPSGDQSGALRTLFKKLAITYHPDRVQDDAAKAARTKIMKDLTQAFESGDLARLVELERTLAVRASGQVTRETPERLAQNLSQSNKELRKQLGELKVELDRLKEDCPFSLDLRLRDPARLARDELDQLVLGRHLEVERAAKTREFVALFAAGRMKVADFVKGPPHLRRFSEAQMAQLLK